MSRACILEFWEVMATNDFKAASRLLHPEFEYYMPQSGEYLVGREAFAGLNKTYPTNGVWAFTVNSVVSEGDAAVSDVLVTDGAMTARAITFHRLKDGMIWRQTEFWPDPYPAPNWRRAFTTVLDQPPF